MKEWEEDLDTLKQKCVKLAEAIARSKRLVVYTGAGVSTSANIPGQGIEMTDRRRYLAPQQNFGKSLGFPESRVLKRI